MKAIEIDAQTADMIKKCVAYTGQNVFDVRMARQFAEGDPLNDEHVVLIPDGFRVIHILSATKDGTTIRHLSICNESPGVYATPWQCETLLSLYDFKNTLDKCYKDIKPGPNGRILITIFEIIDAEQT
jgi:hypothetical protein